MIDHPPASLISRLKLGSDHSLLVPIDEHVIFLNLANQACRAVHDSRPRDLTVMVDRHTASNCPMLQAVGKAATRTRILGEMPTGWEFAESLDIPEFGSKDHFLVLIGTDFALGLWGTADMLMDARVGAFDGGWSCDADLVHHATTRMLAGERMEEAAPSEHSHSPLLLTAQSLMAAQSAELLDRQKNMALDRADLYSVLRILKAISSNRRAHDVLYTFVEQIARVVASDRCSVVRIWGDAETAHVLASHEDADVSDQSISLRRYPELCECLRTGNKVVIEDSMNNPLTTDVTDDLEKAGIRSLLVIPISIHDANVGTLLLRAARREGHFSLREISFFEIVASAANNALERAHLFETIKNANTRLEQLAITDALTGVYNRRHFREYFDNEIERAIRYNSPISCLMIDVDNFKAINDTFGHLVGDSVLKEVADCTGAHIRKTDFLARYGGEEFVVLMPQTSREGACSQADRILQALREHAFNLMPPKAKVTASIGVSVLGDGEVSTADELLHRADTALYEAKRQGKDRYNIAEKTQ